MSEPSPDEFAPLPYFPWLSRPESVPLTIDECATAIFLANGDLDAAAALLKVNRRQLNKTVRRTPRLVNLLTRLAAAGA